MNIEEKLQVAATLEKLGVDVIEAGFRLLHKVTSAVRAIAEQSEKARIAGLARSVHRDIDRSCRGGRTRW